MKILFDATELSYYLEKSGHRAGVFFVALNLFREFQKNPDIELVFSCNFKRYYFLKELINNVEEFNNIELLKDYSFINRIFGKLNFLVRNCPRKIKYGILSLSRYYENLFYIQNKKNKLELEKYKIYFSPFSPASEEIMNSKHIKRFMMLHDTIPIIENNGKIPKNPRIWSYRLYNSINPTDFYFTNSENTKKDFLEIYPFLKKENIITTHLGANDDIFNNTNSQKSPIKSPYVFSLCTLGKRKNLIFGIKNFFNFIEKYNIKDLKIVLAGGIWKNFEKDLHKTIGNFDKNRIILLGYVEDEQLPALYNKATMFIYPSLYEGFGLPVLEAMKTGCPVITSNISSLPEVISNSGITIDPKNDNEMIEAYRKMYFDNDFKNSCIKKGLEQAKKFTWTNCAKKILEVIKEKSI